MFIYQNNNQLSTSLTSNLAYNIIHQYFVILAPVIIMSSLLITSLCQSPSEVFMVRPGNFMFNTETAVTNHYQDITSSNMEWQEVAMQEFDNAVETLRKNNLKVTVFQDTQDPIKPGINIFLRRI